MMSPVAAVEALAEFPDLCADVTGGRRIEHRSVDLHHPAFADSNRQTARIGTVERTRGVHDHGAALKVLTHRARAMVARFADAGAERLMLQDFIPRDLDMIDVMAEVLFD
jgi:hypothetical protein